MLQSGLKINLAIIFTMLILSSLSAHSEPLIVGISETIGEGMPHKVKLIKAVLMDAGLEFEFRYYPGERSLQLLSKGDIALNVYRQPSAILDFEDVRQINPAVDVLKFWLITHASTSHLCDIKADEYSKYVVVGVRGARFFSDYVYPNFFDFEEVNHYSQILHMVADKRVDFSVWPKGNIGTGLGGHSMDVHICENSPYLTLRFYSYLHKDFIWALPAIEKAYKKHFKEN